MGGLRVTDGIPPVKSRAGGLERRIEPRLEILLEAQVRTPTRPGFRSGTILNIGAGGACLMLEDAVEPGSSVTELVFALPDDEASERSTGQILKLRGTVVRSASRTVPGRTSNYVHGLEFQAPEAVADRIRAFVQAELARRSDPPPPGSDPGRKRIRFVRPVVIRAEKLGKSFDEVSTNLSEIGMFLRRDHPPPPGVVFRLRFVPEDGAPPIECRAEVVWTRRRVEGPHRPRGMGIRFLDLASMDLDRIRRLVDAGQALADRGSSEP